jgi:hypothetical protein
MALLLTLLHILAIDCFLFLMYMHGNGAVCYNLRFGRADWERLEYVVIPPSCTALLELKEYCCSIALQLRD